MDTCSYGDADYRSPSYSTAYNGSGGHIDDGSVQSVDLARDGHDDIQLPAPTRAATPTRPALGSRLLSTFASAQPTASALGRKGSLLHARAKSLAGFGPKQLNTTIESSPLKPQPAQTNRLFGDIFSGESAPIRLVPPISPTKEKEESEFVMEYKPAFTERPTRPEGGPRRRSTAQNQSSSAVNTPTRGGWFSRKSTTTLPTTTSRKQDDILAIDINSSLFPNGPADELSPHAFNELLLNATALLQRMQTAYKEKVDYIASIQPEIDAQKEEVEEAETRSRHLKMQLEDMSHKAKEQDEVMQEMALQLAQEKMNVQEARELARNSVKLVRRSTDGEDEETPRRRKRVSGGSASDSGFESDLEYAESAGGAETPLSPPLMTVTPAYDGQDWALNANKSRGGERTGLSRQTTRSGSSSTAFTGKRLGSEGAAWATVESLRGENKDLRKQMEQMQMTLQGCIDFVGTVKA